MGANSNGGREALPQFFSALRRAMVEEQLRRRGIRDERVLRAMGTVPRHEFVPPEMQFAAYSDQPLAIGLGQTISQPFMVAAMAAALELAGSERVLEVGAGSGYQAAVLALLAREVIAVEIHGDLAKTAREKLALLGYKNVRIETGDGTLGWEERAPYDAILVTAAAPSVPPPLAEQLAENGRLVIPVGAAEQQQLRRLRKRERKITEDALFDCRFVPLVGRHGWKRADEP